MQKGAIVVLVSASHAAKSLKSWFLVILICKTTWWWLTITVLVCMSEKCLVWVS